MAREHHIVKFHSNRLEIPEKKAALKNFPRRDALKFEVTITQGLYFRPRYNLDR